MVIQLRLGMILSPREGAKALYSWKFGQRIVGTFKSGLMSVFVVKEIDELYEPVPKCLTVSARTDAYAVTVIF